MRAALAARRRLFVLILAIGAATVALNLWHTPQETDPVDTVLAVVMAAMAGCYLIFMVLTRDEWPAYTLGIFALLAGDLILWGVLIALARYGVIGARPETALNLLRAAFFVGGLILLFDLARWVWERWGRRRHGQTP